MRILLTGSAGPAGRALLRQLTGSAHEVVGVDMAPVADPALESIHRVPAAADPAMLPALARLVREQRIDLVIPTVSDELPQVARAAGAELAAVPVVIGRPEAVDLCDDKLRTAEALAAAGVAVPRYGSPGEFRDTAAAFEVLGRPLIAKPRVSRGGRDVLVVDHEDQLDVTALEDSWILQEFAPGIEYAPMVHRTRAGVAQVVVLEKTALEHGRVGNALAVRRIPQPPTAELSVAAGAEDSADIAALALRAAEALGLHGPADLDVRRTASGHPVVLEVNARFGANSAEAPEILRAVLAEHSPALDPARP